MAKKKVEQKIEEKVEEKKSRKDILKEALISYISKNFEFRRKFDIYEIVPANGTRGPFRDYLKGDFKPEDKRIFREILFELKKEGILFHVGGCCWARIE